ncbi:MAG: hypothetical protein KDA80_14660 [Planctomycetaceae bacterium]|nr:hypothetical protein [Planctomycetaceae bacterium]
MRQSLSFATLAIGFLVVASLIAGGMAAIGSSLFEDWRLVFRQFDSAFRFWAVGLGCGVAVFCIALLFHYEQQLISPKLGWTLLGCRLLLILVLFLTLLEPVWTWSQSIDKRGRVLVAWDVSESMHLSDEHATDVEKAHWGRGAGLFGKQDDRIARWIRDLERGAEPDWTAGEEGVPAEQRDQLARARKANFEDNLKEVDAANRAELARAALLQDQHVFLKDLEANTVVDIVAFGQDFARLTPEQLEQMGPVDQLNVNETRSDLSQTVEAALSSDDESGSLSGIVLLSDGRDTGSDQQDRLLARVRGLGVPVHTVIVGSEVRPRDLAISHLDHPDSVFEGDKPQVKALIQTAGFENEQVTVHLEWVDEPDREPVTEIITPSAAVSEVEFAMDAPPAGRHRFRVQIVPQETETRDDNNTREFSINVVDDRAQVLLVDGEGRWEFRYLDNALKRDPRANVQELLFDQPYLGILSKPFFPRTLDAVTEDDGGKSPFNGYDIVILGDVSPRHLGVREWQLLDKYVRDEGGTLVCTAGKRYFPIAFRGSIVDSLLPIENPRTIQLTSPAQAGSPTSRGFQLSVTADGADQPMFQLAESRAESLRLWSELPGHFWGIVGEVKGAASVWAAALQPGQQASLDHERENALIAQHYVGEGQVLWIGTDSTWRWRSRVGDLYHHRFWGQLVRWAVSFKASAGEGDVKFALRESVIRAGEPAVVQVRWSDSFLDQNPGLEAFAVLEPMAGDAEGSQRVQLARQGGNPQLYEGKAENLPPGEYQVRLEVTGAELTEIPPDLVLAVNETITPELADITANPELLRQIAEETGGRFLQLDQLHEIPDLFSEASTKDTIREEIPLWSHWVVLALFCTIAMVEWVLRKLNGLP